MRRFVIGVALVASAGGCASTPTERYDGRARELGFERSDLDAGDFRIAQYRRVAPAGTRLRVYLEGDGTPWLRGDRIAADPTPRKPFALELAARDPSAVLVLGRPCYHGHATDTSCEPSLWTSARYGEAVVASVVRALTTALADAPRCCAAAPVTLIGYSGGGVLARLLAERVEGVDRVITIAANLDVGAWTRQHGYVALDGSLDPAARAPLPSRVEEIDLVGERDANVPPSTLDAYAARNPAARIVRFADYDHRCCWIDAWPGLLERFDRL